MSRIDLVIFGATGFTGKRAVEMMDRFTKQYPKLTWAVAGRSEDKLKAMLLEVAKKTDMDITNVKVLIADVEDEKSLKEMCSQAKVVVNCVGPYRLYGEPVVRAAIENKANYVDVSGEPQFMERMQLEYDAQARDAGVFVISACGFDSIPCDLGVVFLKRHFGGTLNSIESYLNTDVDAEFRSEAAKCGAIHYATWESLIYGIAKNSELKPLRKKLYSEALPAFKPAIEKRQVIHKHDTDWCLPFPGSDPSIVYRSQRYFYEKFEQRPVQFRAYMGFPSLVYTLVFAFASGIIYAMSKFGLTRDLLLRYPRLFSFGMVSHEGPSQRVMDATHFSFTLHGTGWEQGTDTDASPPNKKVVAKVTGTNPGYGATVVALLLSAITILKEAEKMPNTGGVMTTAVAFHNTSLIEKLNENQLTFEIVDSTSSTKQ